MDADILPAILLIREERVLYVLYVVAQLSPVYYTSHLVEWHVLCIVRSFLCLKL